MTDTPYQFIPGPQTMEGSSFRLVCEQCGRINHILFNSKAAADTFNDREIAKIFLKNGWKLQPKALCPECVTNSHLTDEQVASWRKILLLTLGPYALLMPREEIQYIRNRLQKNFDTLTSTPEEK